MNRVQVEWLGSDDALFFVQNGTNPEKCTAVESAGCCVRSVFAEKSSDVEAELKTWGCSTESLPDACGM
jgi:hypothetical protein